MQPAAIRLQLATVTHGAREPVPGAIEMRVIVGNRTDWATDSTSIRWDPRFTRWATFVESEPAPWRVRIDENGWGTLDTDGVPAGEDGSFILWFRPEPEGVTSDDVPVRVEVVANGEIDAGSGVTTPAHVAERERLARQRVFDRPPLSRAGDALAVIPATAGGAFRVGVAMAAALTAVTAVGGWFALRVANGQLRAREGEAV